MEDREIVALYWDRSEAAIAESRSRYGGYCRYIARQILGSEDDAEETENDVYLAAWNAIPPAKPENLGAYLGMLCRRKAIDRRRTRTREKRGGGQYEAALDELLGCLPEESGEGMPDRVALKDALERFLRDQPRQSRTLFMRRYWWASPVSEIARDFAMKESAVKMQLLRTREKLRVFLEKEGFGL